MGLCDKFTSMLYWDGCGDRIYIYFLEIKDEDRATILENKLKQPITNLVLVHLAV